MLTSITSNTFFTSALIALASAGISYWFLFVRSSSKSHSQAEEESSKESTDEQEPKSVMQAPADELDPPKDHVFSKEELAEYDGKGEKVYVAIKGTVFDVSKKKEMYGNGGSYHLFAGKDASRALGMSSLKPEDASPDYSTLDEKERKVLDDWWNFFQKRYNIMGTVAGLEAKAGL